MSDEQHFAKGEFVFKEGTCGNTIYEIQSGEILIYKDGIKGNKVPLGKLGPGEMFGEMFLLNKEHRRNASAVAVSEVVVKFYSEDVIIQDLMDLTPRQRKFVEAMNKKLQRITAHYVEQITEVLHGREPNQPFRSRGEWKTDTDDHVTIDSLYEARKEPVFAEFDVLADRIVPKV